MTARTGPSGRCARDDVRPTDATSLLPGSKDLIARLDDKMRNTPENFDSIPVVDAAPLLDGSDKHSVCQTNTGFMYERRPDPASRTPFASKILHDPQRVVDRRMGIAGRNRIADAEQPERA